MKKIYRIVFNTEKTIINYIESIGIKVDSNEINAVFYIEENHEKFQDVQEKMKNYDFRVTVSTKFTKKEKDNAKYLVVKITWVNGYPMPDGAMEYREETYDNSHFCLPCGAGLKQNNSFLLKGEPKWGKKDFLKLFWVEDEIFMKKSTYEAVLKPLGINALPVLHYKTKKVLDTVVQLEIKDKLKIDLEDYTYTKCTSCNQIKYRIIENGFFPKILDNPKNSLVARTHEYFEIGRAHV